MSLDRITRQGRHYIYVDAGSKRYYLGREGGKLNVSNFKKALEYVENRRDRYESVRQELINLLIKSNPEAEMIYEILKRDLSRNSKS
jgi:predicted metal-dependent hydrolase